MTKIIVMEFLNVNKMTNCVFIIKKQIDKEKD